MKSISSYKEDNLRNIVLVLLCFANLAYLGYLIILGCYNRFTYEDYSLLATLNEVGFWKANAYMYNNWFGRLVPGLVCYAVAKGYSCCNSLFIYILMLIGLYVYSIAKILKHFLPERKIGKNNFLLFTFAILIFNIFVINNFEFSNFYWLATSPMYFGGIAFALLGLGEMISNSRKIHSYVFLIVGFVYAGSSSGPFGLICTMLLLVLVCYRILNSQINSSAKAFSKKEVIAFLVCLTGFLILFFAPGNKIRQAYFPEPSIINAIKISAITLNSLLFNLIAENLGYLIILTFPFIYLGTLYRDKNSQNDLKLSIRLLLGSIIFVIFLYVTLLPTAWGISQMGPLRSMTHIIFYLVCFFSLFCFLIGYQTLFSRNLALTLSVFSCFLILILSIKGFMFKLPETIKYVRSEDERIEQLLKLKNDGNKDPVFLDRLYSSQHVVLMIHEIAEDSTSEHYWKNREISKCLNLGYDIYLKKEDE
jgi:hypothetical protein